MKKIPLILLAIVLICAFCLYALMQKDDSTDHRYVVQGVKATLAPLSPVASSEGKDLARALCANAPLPSVIQSGYVQERSYQGQRARLLSAVGENVTIQGVTPLIAAPLIRSQDAAFASSQLTLFGYSLLSAQRGEYFVYYLTTEDAAFEISINAPSINEAKEVLSSLQLITND
jgi:hypothetical protein